VTPRRSTRGGWKALEDSILRCTRCRRLREYCREVARVKRRAFLDETYWARPVVGFGDRAARMLLVGLAPGAHGSNRTGRMFTGDASGEFLYASLHRIGLSSAPLSRSREDGLLLRGVFITAVARCAPPRNRPTPNELRACRPFLLRELELLRNLEVIVALGGIAWTGIRASLEELHGRLHRQPRFGHGVRWDPGSGLPAVYASYHPSRQNTQTGRLTTEMFDAVLKRAWKRSPPAID
jgi:uracil-DNA glycosylase family 4